MIPQNIREKSMCQDEGEDYSFKQYCKLLRQGERMLTILSDRKIFSDLKKENFSDSIRLEAKQHWHLKTDDE